VTPFTLGSMRALDSPGQMQAVLDAAVAAGIRHVETAPAYGPAEAFLGQALQRLQARDPISRAALVITSKLLPGLGWREGQEQLLALLRRLAIPRLDNLAVHGLNRPEHLDWALRGEGRELLAWAEGEGLVQQVGFSSHGATALIEAALASGRFGFCSLHLHLFDPERLPLARAALAAGLGVMAISPADKGGRLYDPPAELLADCAPFHPLELAYRFLLDQGISTLTLGAAQPGDLIWAAALQAGPGSSGDGSRCSPTADLLPSPAASPGCPAAGRLPSPAAPPGCRASVPLASAVGRGPLPAGANPAMPSPSVDAPAAAPAAATTAAATTAAATTAAATATAGAAAATAPAAGGEPSDTPPAQVAPTAQPETASPQPSWLSPAHRDALERLAAAARQRLGADQCGQCRQCLPCPQQLPIPTLLRLRNLALGHGMQAFASERYSLIGRAGHWWEQVDAGACERCGDCLPRCPLQLPIPDLLADTHRRLAAPPRRRLWG